MKKGLRQGRYVRFQYQEILERRPYEEGIATSILPPLTFFLLLERRPYEEGIATAFSTAILKFSAYWNEDLMKKGLRRLFQQPF